MCPRALNVRFGYAAQLRKKSREIRNELHWRKNVRTRTGAAIITNHHRQLKCVAKAGIRPDTSLFSFAGIGSAATVSPNTQA
jgi:hypothetical protein